MRHLRRMFNYDYRKIDLFMLREAGVRTFREVEEMIEGQSFADDVPGYENLYRFTGFTRESKPLEVTTRWMTNSDVDTDIEILYVLKPTVEKIVRNFCRHCYAKNNPKY